MGYVLFCLNIYDSIIELNLDPNSIYEECESAEQLYKQKVYLYQLEPPIPQPLEIEVQEVLIKTQIQKLPIHVHVGHRELRIPSSIIIKTVLSQLVSTESDRMIVYNQYISPLKQPSQQIIIHHTDLLSKPVLHYKYTPKRIIKHSILRDVLQTSSLLHNIIISYSKPRAPIEVELVRLPIV